MIRLGVSRLTLDDVVDVARGSGRVELPTEARQRVRAEFSLDAMIARLSAIYREAAAHRKPNRP